MLQWMKMTKEFKIWICGLLGFEYLEVCSQHDKPNWERTCPEDCKRYSCLETKITEKLLFKAICSFNKLAVKEDDWSISILPTGVLASDGTISEYKTVGSEERAMQIILEHVFRKISKKE